MARLEKISNTSWKQPFKDRKREFRLWGAHKEVAKYCKFQDGTKRYLRICFENHPKLLDVTDWFQITSGWEISFPKTLAELVKPIVLNNPDSYFIVQVIDVLSDEKPSDVPPTTGTATIATRVGQNKFRHELIEYWGGCCSVTQLPLTEILKASHIKPWVDSTDAERLDKYNGLLLSPNLDSLFDKGLITFSDSGEIIFSAKAKPYRSGLLTDTLGKIDLEDQHLKYLKYHRENIFKAM